MSQQRLTLLTVASFMENALPLASASLLFLVRLLFCRLTLLYSVIQCRYSSRLSPHSLFSPQAISSKPSFNYYLDANDSQYLTPSADLSFKFQISMSN